jgi:hypothetical protein
LSKVAPPSHIRRNSSRSTSVQARLRDRRCIAPPFMDVTDSIGDSRVVATASPRTRLTAARSAPIGRRSPLRPRCPPSPPPQMKRFRHLRQGAGPKTRSNACPTYARREARQPDLSIPDHLSIPGFLKRAGCAMNGTPDAHRRSKTLIPSVSLIHTVPSLRQRKDNGFSISAATPRSSRVNFQNLDSSRRRQW